MACDDRPVCIFAFYLQIRGGGIFILLFLIRTMHVADISWHKIGKLRRFMFDLILFFPGVSGPKGVRDHCTVPIKGAVWYIG